MITIDDVLSERKKLRNKKRKIFNDDGAAAFYYNRDHGYPVTADKWLGYIFGPHRGYGNHVVSNPTLSDITTFVFNTGYSGYTMHNSQIPDMFIGLGLKTGRDLPITQFGDASQNIIDTNGRDALQIAGDFFAGEDVEFFYGCRVNDRHDATYTKSDLVPIKQRLWDSGGLLRNGINNGLDFANPESRKLMTDTILEVINDDKYLIDGVCLDFNRHLGVFEYVVDGVDVATQEQLDIVTSWFYEINDALNAKSIERMKRGMNPLLMMIKVPDDALYCKLCALDVEKWMRDGAVDILVTSGYRQLRLLQDAVAWGKRFGVAVCPSILDSRLVDKKTRHSSSGLMGRVCQADGASSDGFEFFNWNYAQDLSYRSPSGAFWRSLSYDKTVAAGVRDYYVTWTSQDPSFIGLSTLSGVGYFSDYLKQVSSDTPINSAPADLVIEIYEEQNRIKGVDIHFYTTSSSMQASFNKTSLTGLVKTDYGFTTAISKNILRKGINYIKITSLDGVLTDVRVSVS